MELGSEIVAILVTQANSRRILAWTCHTLLRWVDTG